MAQTVKRLIDSAYVPAGFAGEPPTILLYWPKSILVSLVSLIAVSRLLLMKLQYVLGFLKKLSMKIK